MNYLSNSSNVISDLAYPFENKYLSDLCKIYRSISNNETENKTSLNIFNFKDISILKKDTFAKKVLSKLIKTFLKEIDGNTPNSLKYYPEKISESDAAIINLENPSKHIYIIRDPRDMFLSIKSFNKKRKFNSFGWAKNDSDFLYAQKFINRFKQYYPVFESAATRDDSIQIKYEDLIDSPIQTLSGLEEFLGIKICKSRPKLINRHITSPSKRPELFRWKNELSPDLLELFNHHLSDELNCLKYNNSK